MKIFIQAPTIFNKESPFHKKKKNVLIDKGQIVDIGDKIHRADKVIDAHGMLLSTGWFDLGTYIGDPGFEHKEDQHSLAHLACMGGFTELSLLPNTSPAVQSKNEISYLTKENSTRLVQFYPMACVSKNFKGEELTEMIDLHHAGAIAFTDGLQPVWHADIFLKTLQYLQKFDGLLIDHPEDYWLSLYGQIHEGLTSTRLGLKGIPSLSEALSLSRNIDLLNYSGGNMHCARLSTTKSIELIRNAKKRKLNVSCDITSYQALLTDNLLIDFDTAYKVSPPLREQSDSDSLIKGLNDNTIDVICSGHLPQDDESKNIEFDQAEFGMIALQTFAFTLMSLSKFVTWETLIEKVTSAPRRLLKLSVPKIDIKQKANLTLFNPSLLWTFDESTNVSKSKNSPWYGKKIRGKAVAVFNNNQYWIDDSKTI